MKTIAILCRRYDAEKCDHNNSIIMLCQIKKLKCMRHVVFNLLSVMYYACFVVPNVSPYALMPIQIVLFTRFVMTAFDDVGGALVLNKSLQ